MSGKTFFRTRIAIDPLLGNVLKLVAQKEQLNLSKTVESLLKLRPDFDKLIRISRNLQEKEWYTGTIRKDNGTTTEQSHVPLESNLKDSEQVIETTYVSEKLDSETQESSTVEQSKTEQDNQEHLDTEPVPPPSSPRNAIAPPAVHPLAEVFQEAMEQAGLLAPELSESDLASLEELHAHAGSVKKLQQWLVAFAQEGDGSPSRLLMQVHRFL